MWRSSSAARRWAHASADRRDLGTSMPHCGFELQIAEMKFFVVNGHALNEKFASAGRLDCRLLKLDLQLLLNEMRLVSAPATSAMPRPMTSRGWLSGRTSTSPRTRSDCSAPTRAASGPVRGEIRMERRARAAQSKLLKSTLMHSWEYNCFVRGCMWEKLRDQKVAYSSTASRATDLLG